MTRWVRLIAVGGLLLGAPSETLAKKKSKSAGDVKKAPDKNPGPGDKGTNEGAQGRQNATEDAARDAEPPNASRGSRP